jgi:endonuclease YncB( thermonuclease family)
MGNCIKAETTPNFQAHEIKVHEPPASNSVPFKKRIILKSQEELYHIKDLQDNSFRDLKKATFDGFVTKAKVVSVYDGDTLTLVFYYNDRPIKDSFRMLGYDSPEIHPLNTIAHRDLHIEAAHVARNKLIEKVNNKIVWVKFTHEEKFGRIMGTIYADSEKLTENLPSINDLMISKGYGKAYTGGHKEEFTEHELNRIIEGGKNKID